MEKHNCETCKMRQKYDKAPKSFVGRFWRWHINFCPGWRGYMKSVDDSKRSELKAKYGLR